MTEHAVTFAGDDGTQLSGTVLVPDGDGPFPGALLLNGSGPLDRDSNMPQQRLDIASTIAVALCAAGVASLRFDKRGVGASAGDFVSAGFHTETRDAAAALAALRGVDAVDPDRVGVIGHSVGATISVRLAAADESVAFAVLVGCAASAGSQVMTWQTDRIAATLPGPNWLLGRRFRLSQDRRIRKLLATTDDVVRIDKEDQPALWMREYREYDPADDLPAVRCPALAITGGKDIQVDPAEVARVAASVAGPCTSEVPPDLTHVLRSSTSSPSIFRYRKLIEQPVDAELVATITNWTVEHTSR